MPEEEKVYCSMYSRNAELYHHGIKGQKWGVQNGPPYPLDSDVSTGKRLKINSSVVGGFKKEDTSEKKSNKIKDFIEKKKSEWNSLTDKEKKEKISEIAKQVGLATIAALTLKHIAETLGLDTLYHDIPNEQKRNIKNNDEFLEFKKTEEETPDIEKINPNYTSLDNEWMMNCGLCSVTYDMRKRGYDVTANPSETGRTLYQLSKMYDMPLSKEHPKIENYTDTNSFVVALKLKPEGSRGVISVKSGEWGSGHAMAWEKRDGKVIIIDGQDNTERDLETAMNTKRINTDLTKIYGVLRLDNAFPNDKVKDACRNYHSDYGINENNEDTSLMTTEEVMDWLDKWTIF